MYSYGQCPAYGKKCRKCSRLHHFEENCMRRKTNINHHRNTHEVVQLNIDENIDENEIYFIGTIDKFNECARCHG